jgi:hypothetical protein
LMSKKWGLTEKLIFTEQKPIHFQKIELH